MLLLFCNFFQALNIWLYINLSWDVLLVFVFSISVKLNFSIASETVWMPHTFPHWPHWYFHKEVILQFLFMITHPMGFWVFPLFWFSLYILGSTRGGRKGWWGFALHEGLIILAPVAFRVWQENKKSYRLPCVIHYCFGLDYMFIGVGLIIMFSWS